MIGFYIKILILIFLFTSCQSSKDVKCDFIKENIELWNYVIPERTPYDDNLNQTEIYRNGFKAGVSHCIKKYGFLDRLYFFPKDTDEKIFAHGFNDGMNLIHSIIKLDENNNLNKDQDPFNFKIQQ